MAFGDFAAGMGNTAIGMQQGELVRNQIRAQNQQAEQHASMIRQQQEIEAFNRQARQNVGDATRDMQFNPGQLPQVAGAGQYAPEQDTRVSERNGNYGNEGRGRVPAVTGDMERLQAERKIYEDQLRQTNSNLSAIRDSGTRASSDRAALVSGTAKPLAAAADVLTLPYHAAGFAVEKAGNFVGRVANAAAGRELTKDANEFADRGFTPYYDEHVRKAGRENPGATPEQQDLERQKYGYEQGIAQFDKLISEQKARGAAPAAPAQPGRMDLTEAVRYVESRGNMNAVSPKGAKSDMQVMDGTNRDPGFGVVPARDNSLEERSRVGRDYLSALRQYYGDDTHALIAYNWGPGHANKWLEAGANPQKLPAETVAYVRNVLSMAGGGQQTAAATPQQGQPQAPQQTATGPVQMFSGPDIDHTVTRIQQQYNMLQMQLRNTFDHNQKMQIADKMQSLQFEVQDAQLQKLAHVALQDDNALNQMVGLFTRGTGAMGVQHLPDGSVQLVRPDGQPISGVMSRQELAYNLYNGLSDSQRRKNAEIANVRALEQAKAGGKAAGEAPYNQAQEAQKGQNALNVARTYANADMLKADMANATKMMEVGSPVSLPDGSVVMKMPGGVQFVRPPVETVMPNGKKMMSQPQPEFIPHAAAAATARQAGMPTIAGGAIFGGG